MKNYIDTSSQKAITIRYKFSECATFLAASFLAYFSTNNNSN